MTKQDTREGYELSEKQNGRHARNKNYRGFNLPQEVFNNGIREQYKAFKHSITKRKLFN